MKCERLRTLLSKHCAAYTEKDSSGKHLKETVPRRRNFLRQDRMGVSTGIRETLLPISTELREYYA